MLIVGPPKSGTTALFLMNDGESVPVRRSDDEAQLEFEEEVTKHLKRFQHIGSSCKKGLVDVRKSAQRTLKKWRMRRFTGQSQRPSRSVTTLKEFRKVGMLGAGAFGKVYLVRKITGDDEGELYACKIASRKSRVAFAKGELEVLDMLRHPYIVEKMYVVTSATKDCLIMPYARQGTLVDAMRRPRNVPRARIASRVAAELVTALLYCHSKNVIHRDLKPTNLLVADDGHILLSDFGLAVADAKFLLGDDTFVGTLPYLAPELLTGAAYGRMVDWWAFGCLLYELFVGTTPFASLSCRGLFDAILHSNPDLSKIPAPARPFLDRLLQKEASHRLGSYEVPLDPNAEPFFNDVDWGRIHRRIGSRPFPALTVRPVSSAGPQSLGTNLPRMDSAPALLGSTSSTTTTKNI